MNKNADDQGKEEIHDLTSVKYHKKYNLIINGHGAHEMQLCGYLSSAAIVLAILWG